jgi:YegS/Rv2252/BmrU family lipid kinase
MTRLRRGTVLVNPAARGVAKDFDGTRITRYLARHGVECGLVLPSSAEDATRWARESAGRGDDVLFVVGGDGSVRDAALGLSGSETALAAVPSGTVNIWAREAGIPRGMRAAIDAHLEGQSVHMDLGRADEHCFLLMAGVGWDAEIASHVNSRLKRATGDLAYMLQAAWMAPGLRTRRARWTTPEAAFEDDLAWMVLGNTRLYGGKVHLTPGAVIDDGELDVIAFCPHGFGETLRLAGKVALGKRQDPRIVHLRTPELTLETPGLAVQLDGDYVGQTPMTFSIERGALLVSVPRGPLAPIFAREHIDRRAG